MTFAVEPKYRTPQYCTARYSTEEYSTVQYTTVRHGKIQHIAVQQHSSVQCTPGQGCTFPSFTYIAISILAGEPAVRTHAVTILADLRSLTVFQLLRSIGGHPAAFVVKQGVLRQQQIAQGALSRCCGTLHAR